MRRFIREGYVRYAFTRFGVPYVVSIQCLDSTPRRAAAGLPRGLSGRRAFPESAAHRRRPAVAAAPRYLVRCRRAAGRNLARFQLSPERRHHRQQRLAQARRPRRSHRLFADPLSAGKGARPSPTRNPSASANPTNAAIPGRTISARRAVSRSANAPPASAIRARTSAPARARRKPAKAGDACDPKQQAIVAVRDGVVIRSPKQQAATLQINTRNEHIRFRYMHMNPSAWMPTACSTDARVAEGEKIGVVSNYLDHPNGTSPPSAFRRAGVHARRLALGQSLHHPDLGL